MRPKLINPRILLNHRGTNTRAIVVMPVNNNLIHERNNNLINDEQLNFNTFINDDSNGFSSNEPVLLDDDFGFGFVSEHENFPFYPSIGII